MTSCNRRTLVLLGGMLLLLSAGCNFDTPSKFEVPTWFVDIKFPLVQERYPLGNIVDDKQIFATPDSLGMQIIFEGELPDTSIDPSYLQVEVGQDIQIKPDAVTTPQLNVTIDTTIQMVIPLAPMGLVDVDSIPFTIPDTQSHRILKTTWNQIASAFDTLIQIDINLPEIDPNDLPDFIATVDAIVISADDATDSSMFYTRIQNNGLLTDIRDINFRLLTDTRTPFDTLANHTRSALEKDSTYSETTLLGDDSLGTAIRMEYRFGIAQETTLDTLTVEAGDSVQINLAVRLRIAGVDEAVVTITETDISPDIPDISFPSDIEIYSGVFASNTGFNVNEIQVSNLRSTFPFNISFSMNYKNFLPPAGKDSIKIDTVLTSSTPPISKTFNVDGYTFSNPAGDDSALSSLVIETSAIMKAQQSSIPLDGSELGRFTIGVKVDELHFESLQANIVQQFPPTEQNLVGIPQGFSGMAFTDVKIEFIMLNQIQLPVKLDIDMVGIDTFGDSTTVAVRATIQSPDNAIDTMKTVIRLSQEGTTTLVYDSPSDSIWTDSTTVPPGSGEATIVTLLNSNPATMLVNSAARIDGRGTIVVGASIGGSYRLIAPFEVRMEPMTFISATKTPIKEMDHATRNRIRSSLFRADVTSMVINSMPVGGEISILLSNRTLFPLDTTAEKLSTFRDSLVSQENWDPTDSLYVVTNCQDLDPSNGSVFIFDVMDDYSDCIDGVTYLVRSTGTSPDTVVSYVDTLLKIILPDPEALYTDTSTVGRPGSVAVPGMISHTSRIDTNRIFLMTDFGDHYVAPRFHLNGTYGAKVFLSTKDYIDIRSTITFRISSTGMMGESPDELVVIYPNGGETLDINTETVLKWKTYGTVSKVNIDYATGKDPDISNDNQWSSITTELANVDSFTWTPANTSSVLQLTQAQRDSVKIRVSSMSGDVRDMSGWYFQFNEGLILLRKPKPPAPKYVPSVGRFPTR